MKWHEYPYEYPQNEQACLIRPKNPYYYADHKIATYLIRPEDSRWWSPSDGGEFDPFEYPMWISLDEIEMECENHD